MINHYIQGSLYWYKVNKEYYGAFVLYHEEKHDHYLIGISERLEDIKKPAFITKEQILSAPVFTVSWFSIIALVGAPRMHEVGAVLITDRYENRAGLLIEERGFYLNNCGSISMLKHEWSRLTLKDIKMKDLLDSKIIPKTIDDREKKKN